MATQEAWYLGLRAEALAIVYLTRREDLIVSKKLEDLGLDLLVTISRDGSQSSRIFGIQLKAAVSTPDQADEDSIRLKLKLDNALQEVPFPVCLFFFNVKNDRGYYKWIVEPVTDSSLALCVNHSDRLKRLTDQEVDNIVTLVNSWYDKRK
jgi:hypothetical protein